MVPLLIHGSTPMLKVEKFKSLGRVRPRCYATFDAKAKRRERRALS